MSKQELYLEYLETLKSLGEQAKELGMRFFYVDSQDNCVFQGESIKELPFLLVSSIIQHEHLDTAFKLAIRTVPVVKKILKRVSEQDIEDTVTQFLKENGFKIEEE